MPADLTLSATITRTELSALDLNLHDTTNYLVATNTLDPGQITWRRHLAQSPYVDGALLVHAVRDTGMLQIAIDVFGANIAAIKSNLDTLVEAFSQSEFTLTLTINSSAWSYKGMVADYQTVIDTAHFVARRVQAIFSFPRQPGTGIASA